MRLGTETKDRQGASRFEGSLTKMGDIPSAPNFVPNFPTSQLPNFVPNFSPGFPRFQKTSISSHVPVPGFPSVPGFPVSPGFPGR